MIDGMLSVLIPAYNPDEHLRGILKSLTQQAKDYPFEVIIVDDGSDKPIDWVLEYPRVELWVQENGGEPSARNTLLGLAKGEYFTFIDADDEISPEYLDIVFENMRQGWDWVSYDWTCDGHREWAQQTNEPLMINCAVWAYSFRWDVPNGERFNEKLLVGCDVDWLHRVLKEEHTHTHDDRELINYRWNGNENSLCHRKLRGEFGGL